MSLPEHDIETLRGLTASYRAAIKARDIIRAKEALNAIEHWQEEAGPSEMDEPIANARRTLERLDELP